MLKGFVAVKSGEAVERHALEKLRAILSFLPNLSITKSHGSTDPGIDLVLKSGKTFFLVEVKARLWPNEIPSVAHRLLEGCHQQGKARCVPIVVSPNVSPRTAEQCQKLGLNWADLAGNCHIQFDDVFIHIEGKVGEAARSRGTASLYTPRAARIVHALLLEPQKSWKVVDLAERTRVSLGQVSNVRKLLVQNAFAESSDEGLRVLEPRRLLLDWAKEYRPKRIVKRFYSLRRPGELERALQDHLPSYALTEFAAAERYAPYTRYQSVVFYVPSWRPEDEKPLDLRPAENSPNVTVYEDPEGLRFSESHGSLTVASPIVTYLDLTLLGGRAQGAAEHLLETTILPRWK